MKNGFYAASFSTQLAAGHGVVFLQDGIIRGGDSAIYYLGNYDFDGDTFSGEITTNRHALGLPSVFGRDNVHIKVSGTFPGSDATLTGTAPEAPGVTIAIALKRIGD